MFNNLETQIFEWFKNKYPDSILAQQLDSAKLCNREWTKVGFWVEFEVDKNLPKLDMKVYGGGFPIDGPEIKSKDVDCDGGSLLWGKDGYINCLEMYAHGDYFKEQVGDFELI